LALPAIQPQIIKSCYLTVILLLSTTIFSQTVYIIRVTRGNFISFMHVNKQVVVELFGARIKYPIDMENTRIKSGLP
jgi:hypothetical protein